MIQNNETKKQRELRVRDNTEFSTIVMRILNEIKLAKESGQEPTAQLTICGCCVEKKKNFYIKLCSILMAMGYDVEDSEVGFTITEPI